MENINSSPISINLNSSTEVTSSSETSSQQSNSPINNGGDLEGTRMSVVQEPASSFHSFTTIDHHPPSQSSSSDMTDHEIKQAPSSSPSTMKSSPSLTSGTEDHEIIQIEQRRLLLSEKIEATKTSSLPKSDKDIFDFNKRQKKYIQNLNAALTAINDIPSSMEQTEEDSTILKIALAVDTIIELADDIKDLEINHILDRKEDEDCPNLKSIKEAQQAINHYICYIETLKTSDTQQQSLAFCSAKKCYSQFKAYETDRIGNRAAKDLYSKSVAWYQKSMLLNDHRLEHIGDMFLHAAKAKEERKLEISEFYKKAGICFAIAHKSLKQKADYWNQPGMHFSNAAEALEKGQLKIARLEGLLAESSKGKIDASRQGNNNAFSQFENACTILLDSLRFFYNNNQKLADIHEAAGVSFYDAGKASLKEEHEVAGLLVQAGHFFMNQGDSIELGNEEMAELYRLVAECNSKAAKAPTAKEEWKRAADSYFNVILERAKGSKKRDSDSVIQLFQSSASYSKTIAEEIEKNPDQGEAILTSLTAASLNLSLAAKALLQGFSDLSNAYLDCAANHHRLAIAHNPELLGHFSSQFNYGIIQESAPNPQLINYWTNSTIAAHRKIEEIKAKRQQALV